MATVAAPEPHQAVDSRHGQGPERGDEQHLGDGPRNDADQQVRECDQEPVRQPEELLQPLPGRRQERAAPFPLHEAADRRGHDEEGVGGDRSGSDRPSGGERQDGVIDFEKATLDPATFEFARPLGPGGENGVVTVAFDAAVLARSQGPTPAA